MRKNTVAVAPTLDAYGWLCKQLEDAEPDLLRAMVQTFAETLMSAEASALCNAGYGEITAERLNSRNGYRGPELRHPRRHDQLGNPQTPRRQLLPGLAVGAAAPLGAGVGGRRRAVLRRRRVDTSRR